MPISFTPDLIPRRDETFLNYVNINMQRLKASLQSAPKETISTTPPASPYAGQKYTNPSLGIDYTWNTVEWVPTNHWGPYLTYTPTLTGTGGAGATIGNGSISGAYKREGREWHVEGILTFGTTTSFGTNTAVYVSLPPALTAFNATNLFQEGTGFLNDTGIITYIGLPYVTPNDTKIVLSYSVSDASAVGLTPSRLVNVTGTAPFTWGNTDFLTWAVHIRGTGG